MKKNKIQRLSVFLVALSILLSGCASTSNSSTAKRHMSSAWGKANKAYSNKEWNEAQRLYEILTKQFPEDSELVFRLGVSAYRQGNLALAEASFEKVIKIDPGNVKASYNLGIIELTNAYNHFLLCSINASTDREKRKYKKLAEKIATLR